MEKKIEEPKDLGIKVGSKEMAEWKTVLDAQEDTIRKSRINLIIAKKVLKLAQKHYAEEKAKFEAK